MTQAETLPLSAQNKVGGDGRVDVYVRLRWPTRDVLLLWGGGDESAGIERLVTATGLVEPPLRPARARTVTEVISDTGDGAYEPPPPPTRDAKYRCACTRCTCSVVLGQQDRLCRSCSGRACLGPPTLSTVGERRAT